MQSKVAAVAGWFALGVITQCNLLQAQEAKPANVSTNAQPLIEWHSAGFEQINLLRDLSNYRQILNLTESRTLRDSAIEKLANYSASRLLGDASTGDKQQMVDLVKPLFRSAFDSELRFELLPGSGGNVSWVFAVKAAQKEVWSTNLWQLASIVGQTPTAGKVNGTTGWTSSVPGRNYKLAFWNQREWLYVAGGAKVTKSEDPFAGKRLSSQGQSLVRANFDLPALGKMMQNEKLSHAPRIALNVDPRGNALRSEMTLTYAQDLGIKPEPWQIPTNSIKDPVINGQPGLIGFTAIQGTARMFEKSETLKAHGIHQNPNQVFLWADALNPFSVSFATQVGNPGQFLKNLFESSGAEVNQKLARMNLGKIGVSTNESRLSWSGLPIVIPFLTSGSAPDQKFLIGGLFPVANPSTNVAPAELFAQVTSQKNLVFYEWEITEARLAQWRPMIQLYHILSNRNLNSPDSPGEKWLTSVQQYLGNTITEATSNGRNELKITRRSDIGLNAFELALLVDYLENPSFPGWNRPRNAPPKNTTPVVQDNLKKPAKPSVPAPKGKEQPKNKPKTEKAIPTPL